MPDIDLTLIQTVRKESKKISRLVAAMPSIPEMSTPQNAFSNFDVLLTTVEAFYRRSKKAPFLPASISLSISTQLTQIGTDLSGVPTGSDQPTTALTPEILSPVLQKMDALYAYCLQYGLISFGFGPKLVQEQVDLVRAAVADVEAAKLEAQTKIQVAVAKLSATIDEAATAATVRQAAVEQSLTETLESVAQHVIAIETHGESVETVATTTAALLGNIQKKATESAEIQVNLAALLTSFTEETTTAIAETKTTLANSQATERQIGEYSANAKALVQGVTDARAAIEGQLKVVTAFYTEIEKHRQEMLETRKLASADVADLKASSETTVAEFGGRTAKIMTENEALQRQIRSHLDRAVGVGLFTAFENRRKSVNWAAWVWVLILCAAIGVAIGIAYHVAEAFGRPDANAKVLLARLLVAAPIAFLIGFAARQYSRNKQAEEEYAFKASISVSLDSFRQLIEKMRKEDNFDEIPFVKEYVKEIYDNPSKRLYPGVPELPAEEENVKAAIVPKAAKPDSASDTAAET